MYGNGNNFSPYEPPPPAPKVTASYQASGLTDGVIVPILKSVFIGFTTGVLAGLLAWAFHATFSPWAAWLITWFAVMAFSFWRYSERGAWLIERITGADLNGDTFIGQPTPPALPTPQTLRVDLIKDEGRSGEFIDLPYPDRLPQLAAGLIAGRSFNQTAWTGQGAIFSRAEFDQLRDTLIERGLLAWKNPRATAQGTTLTAAGRAVMKRIANQPPALPGENGR